MNYYRMNYCHTITIGGGGASLYFLTEAAIPVDSLLSAVLVHDGSSAPIRPVLLSCSKHLKCMVREGINHGLLGRLVFNLTSLALEPF